MNRELLIKLRDNLPLVVQEKVAKGNFQFDMNTVALGTSVTCQTAGCAWGCCPAIFPDDLELGINADNRLWVIFKGKPESADYYLHQCMKFFELTLHEATHIFSPMMYETEYTEGEFGDYYADGEGLSDDWCSEIPVEMVVKHINEVLELGD